VDAHVFICHASVEGDRALLLERLLQQRGFASWIGPRDVAVGNDYVGDPGRTEWVGRIALLYSAHSSASPDCKREIAFAIEYRVPIYVIRLDATPGDDSWSYR
jgi:hypothetical protein